MLKKAEAIYERYRFLTEKLSYSDVLQDMDVWRKYSKEQAEITDVADKYQEYVTVERDMQSAFETAESETDA
jgi:peptide chain release factor 1